MPIGNSNNYLNLNIVEFAQSKILDEINNEVSMHTLWREQTAILIFLRHFACIECRKFAQQIWLDRKKYEASGGRIRFIGNGQARFIKAFKEDLNIQEAPIYTDPSLKVFRAAGFKRGFLAAAGPKSLLSGLKMYRDGHKQDSYEKGKGDLWQMGGVIVMNPEGRLTYKYVSQVLGDFPPEKDLGNTNV